MGIPGINMAFPRCPIVPLYRLTSGTSQSELLSNLTLPEWIAIRSHGIYKDDQFDLSDAMMALAISLLAITVLVQKRWLYGLALIPSSIGVLMGLSGLLGWHIHSDLIASLLS